MGHIPSPQRIQSARTALLHVKAQLLAEDPAIADDARLMFDCLDSEAGDALDIIRAMVRACRTAEAQAAGAKAEADAYAEPLRERSARLAHRARRIRDALLSVCEALEQRKWEDACFTLSVTKAPPALLVTNVALTRSSGMSCNSLVNPALGDGGRAIPLRSRQAEKPGFSDRLCYDFAMIARRSALFGLCSCLAGPLHAWAEEPVPAIAGLAPVPDTAVELEMLRLQDALAHEVPHLVPRTAAGDAAWVALARAETAGAEMVIDRPQLLVVVDRNPLVQQLAIVLARPNGEWQAVGGSKVSTGSTGRFDHYITPRGVSRLTDAVLGYRAEGTLNENGIRGLGTKGMRVWDFGWQVAMKGWNAGPGKPDRTPIRLMMHATDPARLEQRIGRPASQGCIRIPSAMNRFLDRHGVLDSEYERLAATDIRFRSLLLPGREPTPLAGNTLVVVDSGEQATATTVASRQPVP